MRLRGYWGWDRGLSIGWGRTASARFVSIAWRQYIAQLSWGRTR